MIVLFDNLDLFVKLIVWILDSHYLPSFDIFIIFKSKQEGERCALSEF
jgi:hypothetical protein